MLLVIIIFYILGIYQENVSKDKINYQYQTNNVI